MVRIKEKLKKLNKIKLIIIEFLFEIFICFCCLNFSFFGVSANECVSNQETIDRFRKHLISSWARCHNGEEIKFNNEKVVNYSNILSDKMREFLDERKNLNCQQFYDSCFEYLKGSGEPIKVLNELEFENLIKSNDKKYCKLYVGVKSDNFADEFKNGNVISDKAKKYFLDESAQIKKPYSQYLSGFLRDSYGGLFLFENFESAASEAAEFDEGQLVFPGFVGELVVHDLNVVDLKFLEEVLAATRYFNPQEFGLCNEIEHYFNADDEEKMLTELCNNNNNDYKNCKDIVDCKYDSVLSDIFSNKRKIYDELNESLNRKTGESFDYADVMFKFNLNQKNSYEEKISNFCFEHFGKSLIEKIMELGFEGDFVNNNTLALMKNYGVIAKLLGFDAIKFDVGPYTANQSQSSSNFAYVLLNFNKVEAVCLDLMPTGFDEHEVWRVPADC